MLIDNIKHQFLFDFTLKEENALDVCRLDLGALSSDDKRSIDKYLLDLEKSIKSTPSEETGFGSLFSMRSISKSSGGVRNFVDQVNDFILSMKNTIFSGLLVKKESPCSDICYMPLFLVYYCFPKFGDFLDNWRNCPTNSDEFMELYESPYYNFITLMKDLPSFDETTLNDSDKRHVSDSNNPELLFKYSAEAVKTNYLKRVESESGVTVSDLLGGNSSENCIFYDFQTISGGIAGGNLPNEIKFEGDSGGPYEGNCVNPFIVVILNNGKKILSLIPSGFVSQYRCTSIVFVPKNIEFIKGGAFRHCDNVIDIVFEPGSNLKYVGASFNSDFLPSLFKLPDSVEVIGDAAFYSGCSSNVPIQTFIFPKNLKKISYYAFYTFDSHQSPITIIHRKYSPFPSQLEEIGDYAFATGYINCVEVGTNDKKGIPLNNGKKFYDISDTTVEYDPTSFWAHSYIPDFSNCKKLRKIGNAAFRRTLFNDQSYDTLVIPASVEEIGDYAFADVKHLNKVVFEKGTKLRYLGKKAFINCSSLKEVVFESTPPLERINYMTFAFTDLKKIDLTMLTNLKVIEACAFVLHPARFKLGKIQPEILVNPGVINYGPFRVKEVFEFHDIKAPAPRVIIPKSIKNQLISTPDPNDYIILKAPSPSVLASTYKEHPQVVLDCAYSTISINVDTVNILMYLEYLNSDKYINGKSPKIPTIIQPKDPTLVVQVVKDTNLIRIEGTYVRKLLK
jgi:hypothetical protein